MRREIADLRETVVKLTQLLAGKKLRVSQIGTDAWVKADPRTGEPLQINIPNVPDNADDKLIAAISGFIDHECAHVLFTDFTLKIPPAIHSLWNMVEDTMIERKMGELFPGARSNIKRTGGFFLERISHPRIKEALGENDDKKAFAWLLVPVIRALAGQSVFQEFMDDNGYWRQPYVAELVAKLSDATKSALSKVDSTKEALAVAKVIAEIVNPPASPAAGSASSSPKQKSPPPSKAEKSESDAGEGKGEKEHTKNSSKASSQDASDDESGEAEASDEAGASKGSKSGKEKDDDAESDADSSGADDDVEDTAPAGSDSGDDATDDDATADDDAEAAENEGAASEESDGGENDGTSGENDGDASDHGENVDDDELEGLEDDDDGAQADADGDTDSELDEDEALGEDDKPANAPRPSKSTEADDADGAEPGDDANTGESEPSKLSPGEDEDADLERHDEEGDAGTENGVGAGLFSAQEPLDMSTLDLSAAISAVIGDESAVAIAESPYAVFSRDFDKMEIVVPNSDYRDAWLPQIEDETRAMVGKMQKDVERMMAAQSRNIKVGGQRRGRLNAPNLHRILAGDDRVFAQKEIHRSKDTAVTLLIDNSGSMRGVKYTTAMVAGYALSSTLDRVNIANEAIGFTTHDEIPDVAIEAYNDARKRRIKFHRVQPLLLQLFKEFDERLNPTIRKRFAFGAYGQPGLWGNVDGECLEIAALRLMKRREKRKVMIVLSDGQPVADDHRAGEAHLQRTVADLSRRGIDMVGIGILDSTVKRFYPNNIVLNNVAELPGTVMTQLKRILG